MEAAEEKINDDKTKEKMLENKIYGRVVGWWDK